MILRYANVYGPRQRPDGEAGVVAIFAERLVRGESVTIFGKLRAGDGGGVRDYVFIDDVVRANMWAVRDAPNGTILDVATGDGTSTDDLLQLIAGVVGAGTAPLQAAPRPGDRQRSVLDPGALRAELGEPTRLAEGLSRTLVLQER